MVGVKRSHVQFHGHAKERRKKDKAQIEQQTQAKATPNGHRLAPHRKATTTTVPRLHDQNSKGEARGDEPDTEATAYEDVHQVAMSPFPKKRVESLEKLAHSGHFQSKLHAEQFKMVESQTASESAIEIDYPDSPPASLLMEASAYVKRNAEIQAQHRGSENERPLALVARRRRLSPISQEVAVDRTVAGQLPALFREEPQTEQSRPQAARNSSSSSTSSSSPLLKSIVNLFAGRKRSNKTESVQSPTTYSHEGISWARAERAHPPTPPPSPFQPKLTIRQVVPAIWRPTAYDPWRHYGYKIIEGAPENRFQGTGVRHIDIYTPETVQRGFNVPTVAPPVTETIQRGFNVPTSPTPTTTKPLVPRRKPLASRLLDRNGDPWARWYDSEEGGGGARD
jgi:hypothetical protein